MASVAETPDMQLALLRQRMVMSPDWVYGTIVWMGRNLAFTARARWSLEWSNFLVSCSKGGTRV